MIDVAGFAGEGMDSDWSVPTGCESKSKAIETLNYKWGGCSD